MELEKDELIFLICMWNVNRKIELLIVPANLKLMVRQALLGGGGGRPSFIIRQKERRDT